MTSLTFLFYELRRFKITIKIILSTLVGTFNIARSHQKTQNEIQSRNVAPTQPGLRRKLRQGVLHRRRFCKAIYLVFFFKFILRSTQPPTTRASESS